MNRPGESVSRVGLFGGTFNPVHFGHIQIAEDVRSGFCLDSVWVVPSAVPPHKSICDIADAADRLKMVNMCFSGRDGFEVSDIELNRQGPSYTIDTIRHLISEYIGNVTMFMMIGTDAFFEIHTWKAFDTILDLVPLIVMTRPGDRMESDQLKETRAGEYLKDKVHKDYVWDATNKSFSHVTGKEIFFFNVTQLEISSTKIRNLVKQGKPVTQYVTEGVADYITNKGLYK